MLRLGDPVTLLEKRELIASLFFVACVLSARVCLLFLIVLLVGYALWLWLFPDIFYTNFLRSGTISEIARPAEKSTDSII